MITVKNLYYLLLYAWDFFEPDRMAAIDAEPETDLVNLLANVLNRGIDHLLRRGADRGYLLRVEDIPGIRGKLDLSATAKTNMLVRARTVCHFDELSFNVLHNRILKTTVRRLLQTSILDGRIREPLRNTYRRLGDVEELQLTGRHFEMVQLHRNIRFYRFLLHVCRLLYDCLVPDETTGTFRFRDFSRDEQRMHRLFEKFLRKFYKHEQETFAVSNPSWAWAETTGADSAAADLLPTLNLDLCLTGSGRIIVLDAKYYRDSLQQHFGRQSLHSAHLYQMFAYLKNVPGTQGADAIEGMLVYALADRPLDHSYRLHGHRVRITTIDLKQHWTGIRRDLLALLTAPVGP
jgi:5-methylcytosine-specific restriction enzyme subunit McrC